MSTEADVEKVLVLARDDSDFLGGESVWRRIDPEVLRTNLQRVLGSVRQSLPGASSAASSDGWNIKEVAVALTIGASGQVGILGTGVEVSGEASITVTLSR